MARWKFTSSPLARFRQRKFKEKSNIAKSEFPRDKESTRMINMTFLFSIILSLYLLLAQRRSFDPTDDARDRELFESQRNSMTWRVSPRFRRRVLVMGEMMLHGKMTCRIKTPLISDFHSLFAHISAASHDALRSSLHDMSRHEGIVMLNRSGSWNGRIKNTARFSAEL